MSAARPVTHFDTRAALNDAFHAGTLAREGIFRVKSDNTSWQLDITGRGFVEYIEGDAALRRIEPKEFAESDLVFGPVTESTNPARESEVAYSAHPDSPDFEGSAVAFYNRIDLTQLFLSAGIEVVQVADIGFTTVGEVVDVLNARYSLQFGADDIQGLDAAVEGNVVTLQANPASYGFKGQVSVELVEGKTPFCAGKI